MIEAEQPCAQLVNEGEVITSGVVPVLKVAPLPISEPAILYETGVDKLGLATIKFTPMVGVAEKLVLSVPLITHPFVPSVDVGVVPPNRA